MLGLKNQCPICERPLVTERVANGVNYRHENPLAPQEKKSENLVITSGYATWFTAGGAIRIAHYDVIDDVITRKL